MSDKHYLMLHAARSSFYTETISVLKAKGLLPSHLWPLIPSPWRDHLMCLQTYNPLHSFSSLLALRTYRDSSSCRPNGCRAQGVSKSGSDFGPRQRSVATVASDQTWTDQRKMFKFKPQKRCTDPAKGPHLHGA